MGYINRLFTYLLTYLLTVLRLGADIATRDVADVVGWLVSQM